MKKLFLTLSICAISLCGFSQKIGIKIPKQDITVIPAIVINTDTIGVTNIWDNGTSVRVSLLFSQTAPVIGATTITLWEGSEYAKHENWTNADILQGIKDYYKVK